MLSTRETLIIAGVGVGVIVLSIVFYAIGLSRRSSPPECGPPASAVVRSTRQPVEHCPAPAPAPSPASSADDAETLVKRLMNTARRISDQRRGGEEYYHMLLRNIYHKFSKLNAHIINQDELKRSQKFLEEIKKEVHNYQKELDPQAGGGSPSCPAIFDIDLQRIIENNAEAVLSLYPSLRL